MSSKPKHEIVCRTDVGQKRTHNEDSIGSDPEIGLAVLADGMGGYKAGEVASAIAVNVLLEEARSGFRSAAANSIDKASGMHYESLLVRSAIQKANSTVYQTAQSQPQCQGMGTTIVAVAFLGDTVCVAHVGDSRLYRFRDDILEQVTSDHSLLQELIDKGFYTPEEARQSNNKNLVTRAIGIEASVEPEVREHQLKPGDLFLLCSDGLSDPLEHKRIEQVLRTTPDLEAAAEELVKLANENGGRDNISVILARSNAVAPAGERHWYSKVFDWF